LLRVDPESAFVPALKSRAWAQSKGQNIVAQRFVAYKIINIFQKKEKRSLPYKVGE
jgi:hypothetical protein